MTLPTSPDSGTNVHYEVCAEWGKDFKNKSLLISNFTTEFKKGKNKIIDDFMPKIKMNKDMRLFVVISYIYKYNILNLRQPIILSEVQKTTQSGTQTLTVNEPANEISCECTIQRYMPIIRVNCSHENSTHRIITNAYELNSFKPSESKPQVIQVKEGQLYGVFQLKRIDDNVESVIIHMLEMQPLCAFVSFVKKESIVKKEIYWFSELIAMTVFGGIGSALLVVIIILIVILCASHKAGIVCEEP